MSSQLNPIVQPAKLTTPSPSMSSLTKPDSKHENNMTIGKDGFSPKFTTSNFTETIVVNSDSVFGPDGTKGGSNNSSNSSSGQGKKRKSDGRIGSGTNIDDSNK